MCCKTHNNKECLDNQAFFYVKKLCSTIIEFLSLRSFSRFRNSPHVFKAGYSRASSAVILLPYS